MRPSFEASAEARLLAQRLKSVPVGGILTFAEMEAEVSRPLDKMRGALGTALRRCLRDDNIVFANIRSVGYRRCDDIAIVDEATSGTDRIRRSARRAVERLTKVSDYAALPPPKQLEHTTRLSVLGAIATVTRETSIQKVRNMAQGRSSELPLAETMRAFLE